VQNAQVPVTDARVGHGDAHPNHPKPLESLVTPVSMPEKDPSLPEALDSHPLTQGLSPDQKERVSSFSRIRRYRAGQRIVEAHDKGTELFLLLSGSVKVAAEDFAGREITLAVLYPRDFFGEVSLWDNGGRTAAIETLEPTQVVAILGSPLLDLMREFPEIAFRLLSTLSTRLRETDAKLMNMAYGDAYQKVARALVEIYSKEGASENGLPYIRDRFTRQELASLAGVTRETVSRSLGAFVLAGVIRLEKERIVLLSLDRLKKEGQVP